MDAAQDSSTEEDEENTNREMLEIGTCITFTGSEPGESSTDMPEMLAVPSMSGGTSSETLVGSSESHSPFILSAATSSDTLVPGSPVNSPLASPQSSPKKKASTSIAGIQLSPAKIPPGIKTTKITAPPMVISTSNQMDALALSPGTSPKLRRASSPGNLRHATSPTVLCRPPSPVQRSSSPGRSPAASPKLKRASSPLCYSISSPNIITNINKNKSGKNLVACYLH